MHACTRVFPCPEYLHQAQVRWTQVHGQAHTHAARQQLCGITHNHISHICSASPWYESVTPVIPRDLPCTVPLSPTVHLTTRLPGAMLCSQLRGGPVRHRIYFLSAGHLVNRQGGAEQWQTNKCHTALDRPPLTGYSECKDIDNWITAPLLGQPVVTTSGMGIWPRIGAHTIKRSNTHC